MHQQAFRVNFPACITFAGGDVVKERFHVLLPRIQVGMVKCKLRRNDTITCKDVASAYVNGLFDSTGRRYSS